MWKGQWWMWGSNHSDLQLVHVGAPHCVLLAAGLPGAASMDQMLLSAPRAPLAKLLRSLYSQPKPLEGQFVFTLS